MVVWTYVVERSLVGRRGFDEFAVGFSYRGSAGGYVIVVAAGFGVELVSALFFGVLLGDV